MSAYPVRLPDVGEGVAEAELISWLVNVGDEVTTDTLLAEVMTDKATVEVVSPVRGVVLELRGSPGDVLSVGSELVLVEIAGDAPAPPDPTRSEPPDPTDPPEPPEPPDPPDPTPSDAAPSEQPEPPEALEPLDAASAPAPPDVVAGPATERRRVLAAPAVRSRADRLGIDLAAVRGSGPEGRVVHDDLDRLLLERAGRPGGATDAAATPALAPSSGPLRGVRRRIAQRTTASWTEIPHITYVDAVDATELEVLRAELNVRTPDARLTMLPFIARAVVLACLEQPGLNAHLVAGTDDDALTLTVHDAVHLGIATQTDDGLKVPVVRHAERLDLAGLAREIARVSEAARQGTATRDELTGSTITITSLGALGGLVTTPIINRPEVSIVGVNRLETRPVWRDGSFQPRQVFNLSSSFDHRVVDGWDAATFVQRIRRRLEIPALLHH
ncbi:MAG: dihydrolipoamide acetyltransferase family protein [Ilumatobacteraceae bacterium]